MSSSTQKPKYMGKPFIKKIYETHKKWLGGESKSQKSKKYENIEFKVEEDQAKFDSIQSDKLRIVINSFDKILDEYSSITSVDSNKDSSSVSNIEVEASPVSPPVPKRHSSPKALQKPSTENVAELPKVVPPPRKHSTPKKEKALIKQQIVEKKIVDIKPITSPTKIPKLVKAKTCSIIESKCILKKTNSNSSLGSPASLQLMSTTKTKSMSNLDMNATTPVKIVPIIFDLPCPQSISVKQKIAPEVPPKPFLDVSTNSTQQKFIESPVKVKELVKRLNNLTEINSVTVETPAPSIPAQPVLSKAVSTTNLSLSKKLGSISRIPVNSSLRKSFPSTPCHLDRIDSTGSAQRQPGMSKAKSIQNLAKPRLSLQLSNSSSLLEENQNGTMSKARSVQNLAKPRLSLPREPSSIGKSVPDLIKNKTLANKQNTVKAKVATRKVVEVKPKLPVSASTSTSPKTSPIKINKEKSKLMNVAKPKQTVVKTSSVDGSKGVIKKSDILTKLKPAEDVDPKNAFVAVRGPRDKNVNIVIKKLENKVPQEETNIVRNQVKKAEKTFGEKKAQYEQKSVENSLRKGPSTVKLDVQPTKNLAENDSKFYLASQDFVDGTRTSKKIKSEKCLDYNSDNSDDSGNISNEVDCDEVNSTSSVRSRTSTESLSTVLSSKGVTTKDLSVGSCNGSLDESPKKIFFRTGVVSQLEAQRDERLAGVVISLQAHCRGYLARRKLQQRKLQDLAVRCIQRNVRKFMLVRDWPWWRLLVRVTPLLNVHRTEEELRAKTRFNLTGGLIILPEREVVTAVEEGEAELSLLDDFLDINSSE
ncbi:unnamed protein product [Ceutorhynchus assimilis]|uniref:Uncharacterized protein n=1 Tax=Ceutorhynchus assimilis TaxID=467358 RepID=A0A9N9QQM6_9CUCU|nr:unnamed protein product [Ceutorhynchus assimilis]